MKSKKGLIIFLIISLIIFIFICYNVFSNKIDGVLKNIQGANIHTGRKGKRIESKIVKKDKKEEKNQQAAEGKPVVMPPSYRGYLYPPYP